MGPWFDFLLSWSAWQSPQVKTEPQISPTVNQSDPVNGLILTHSYTLSQFLLPLVILKLLKNLTL